MDAFAGQLDVEHGPLVAGEPAGAGNVASQPAAAYTAGSQADFDRLYRASYQRVLYTLLAVLRDYQAAEDCAQETFVRAFRSWKDWQPDAPAEAWLHRIALNVAFSYRRWHRLREVGEVVRRLGGPRPDAETPDLGLHSDLLDALRRLPPEQAATIIMRHHHGYTNREIAAALGVPESTVASRLAAAKLRLRQELE
ncbi:MAG TPA: RNA polymerase sigma factor [Chloroflexota bacterium]|nr:RNA polymerase sigma factor [Chloroflexota bacterium]